MTKSHLVFWCGHVTNFDLNVLSHFQGVSEDFIEALREHHNSCLVIPHNWEEIFGTECAAALANCLDPPEAALTAAVFTLRVLGIDVPQRDWSILMEEGGEGA